MTYTVQIKVMPLKELLDPQGKAVMGGLENLGLSGVEDVRWEISNIKFRM